MRVDHSNQRLIDLPNDAASTGDTGAPATDAPDVLPGVSALTMTTAHDEEQVSRQQRDEAMTAQEKADAAAIQDLHDKANLQRIQGVVDGACDFAQAGTDLAQGAEQLGSTIDRMHASTIRSEASYADDQAKAQQTSVPSDVRDANTESANALDQQSAHESAAAESWKAEGELIGGGKQIADGLFQGAITDKDADEKTHEASADAFKQIADDAHDDEKDAKDLMNKALDFYKEYVDTKNQTAMAAIHRA